MLTKDDLKAIKSLITTSINPLEEKIDKLDTRMDRFEKKNDKQHAELQGAINRVADIHDDKIFVLEQWKKQVDKNPAFNFAT